MKSRLDRPQGVHMDTVYSACHRLLPAGSRARRHPVVKQQLNRVRFVEKTSLSRVKDISSVALGFLEKSRSIQKIYCPPGDKDVIGYVRERRRRSKIELYDTGLTLHSAY